MFGSGTTRHKEHQRLVLPLVTLGYPVRRDVHLPALNCCEFLQLERIFLRPYVKPVSNARRKLLTFLSKLRITHPPRLRQKYKITIASPKEGMSDIRMRLKEAVEVIRMIDVGKLLLGRFCHFIGTLGDAFLGDRQNLLIIPLNHSLERFFALYGSEVVHA